MTDVATKQRDATRDSLKAPGKYKVIVLNDDVTPADFVVAVMIAIFKHSESRAVELTMMIHNEGSAVAGIYSYEIAEQKCVETTKLARENGFPLALRIEVE